MIDGGDFCCGKSFSDSERVKSIITELPTLKLLESRDEPWEEMSVES